MDWQATHKGIGCTACLWADPRAVGRAPCCTHVLGPKCSGTGGRCVRSAERAALDALAETSAQGA